MHHNDFGTENDRNNVLGHQKWSAWLITPGRCYPLEVVRGWPWLAGEKMPPFHPLVVQIWPYRAATPVFWWQRQLWCWSHCMLMDCAWLLYASLKPELPTLRCFPGASSCILQGCHRLKSSQPSQFCGAPMGSPLCLRFENVRSANPARLWRCRHWLQKNGLLTVSCGCWMVFWHILRKLSIEPPTKIFANKYGEAYYAS